MTITDLDNPDFCNYKTQILEHLEIDKALREHFKIETEKINISYNPIIDKGIPNIFFIDEVAKLRTEKKHITIEKAYEELQNESIQNKNIKFRVNCLKNPSNKEDSDLIVGFWYSKKDDLIVVDITKKNDNIEYASGYLYLIEIGNQKQIKIISETFWVE